MDKIITHLEFANDWSQIDQYALLGVIVQNNQGSATLLYIRIRINDRNKYEIILDCELNTIGIQKLHSVVDF